MKEIEPSRFHPKEQMKDKNFALFYNYDELPVHVENHLHSYYEFYFLISGKAIYTIDKKAYLLKSGDVMFIKPNQSHYASLEPVDGKKFVRYVLWVNAEYLENLCTQATDLLLPFEKIYNSSSKIHVFSGMQMMVLTLLQNILRSSTIEEYGADLLQHAYMIELLVALARIKLYNSSTVLEDHLISNHLVSSVLEYISIHITEEIRTDELAEQLFVSRSHLSRVFTKFMGLSVHDFIIKKKLYLSKQALMGKVPIGEVYRMYGFGDYSSFYRAFRKEFGVSPQKLKKELQDNEVNI